MMRNTRAILILLGVVALADALMGGSVLAQDVNKEHVIKIVAQRFSYTPNEILLKKGQSVVLEFTSLDFVHGFSVPDLSIRADLIPGKVTQVKLTPDKEGKFDFLCDNFCGYGHEEMNGRIIVKD